MGARPTVGSDGTHRDDAAVLVEPAARRRDDGLAGTGRQPYLDDGPLAAGTHPGRVTPTAGDQAEGGDDHGLAGAGLTRDHGEAGVRFEHGVVDDTEVADPQFVKHGLTVTAGTDSDR